MSQIHNAPLPASSGAGEAEKAETVLTHSALKAYRGCAQRYSLAYVQHYRAIKVSKALIIGTAFHRAVEVFWRAYSEGHADPVALAVEVLAGSLSGFDLALVRPLLLAYAAVWSTHKWEVLAVEVKFRMHLRHPDGRISKRFVIEGRIDRIARGPDGILRLIEVKTSGVDTSEGSPYRRRLARDEQISFYLDGAESLGYKIDRITYDVARKPRIKPRKATPLEKRVMVKDRKTKEQRLKAGQREHDETPDEFEMRVAGLIATNPSAYIQRFPLERTPAARERFRLNIWHQSAHLGRDIDVGHFSENSDACELGGMTCQFAPFCLDGIPLNDPYVFKQIDATHPELEDEPEVEDDSDDEAAEA